MRKTFIENNKTGYNKLLYNDSTVYVENFVTVYHVRINNIYMYVYHFLTTLIMF